MLWRENHVIRAVDRVVPRRENADAVGNPGDREIDLGAFTATDPISLQ